MKENNKKYDAIIIGGGHNGLVAACYLAKAGKSVILLESNKELGGATTMGLLQLKMKQHYLPQY